MAHLSRKSVERINDVIDKVSKDAWTRGYFCAVAALLREESPDGTQYRAMERQQTF